MLEVSDANNFLACSPCCSIVLEVMLKAELSHTSRLVERFHYYFTKPMKIDV